MFDGTFIKFAVVELCTEFDDNDVEAFVNWCFPALTAFATVLTDKAP